MMKAVGASDGIDFIFPGHQVVLERANSGFANRSAAAPQRVTPLTGSSVATALAAGLAAVTGDPIPPSALPAVWGMLVQAIQKEGERAATALQREHQQW